MVSESSKWLQSILVDEIDGKFLRSDQFEMFIENFIVRTANSHHIESPQTLNDGKKLNRKHSRKTNLVNIETQ